MQPASSRGVAQVVTRSITRRDVLASHDGLLASSHRPLVTTWPTNPGGSWGHVPGRARAWLHHQEPSRSASAVGPAPSTSSR
jgi:hypothetical protein